jgi:hypothetical protein
LAYGVTAADLGMVVNPSIATSALTGLKLSALPDLTYRSLASPDYEDARCRFNPFTRKFFILVQWIKLEPQITSQKIICNINASDQFLFLYNG